MNILLVDDNPYTIRALKNGIDYMKLGFSSVLTARNMKEAIACMEKEEIAVVLTDIEMPNGTGLQLLEWINEYKEQTVTLFCTSYANFDYAKKAVELHSFDYYLKPIQYEDLQKILEKAVEEVQRRCRQKEQEKYEKFWKENLSAQKAGFWKDLLFWVEGYEEEELCALAESRHLDYSSKDKFTLGMLKFPKEKSRMSEITGKLEQFIMNNIAEELCDSEEIRMEMLHKCGADLWTMVLTHSESFTRAELYSKFQLLIEKIRNILKSPVIFVYAYQVPFLEVRNLYMKMEDFCKDYIPTQKHVIDIECFKKEQEQSQDEADIQCAYKAARMAKEYVDEHFCEEITREVLSEVTHFSSGYLASSFKKEFGVPIGNYIIEKRIEKAKKLLKEQKLSVTEVAQAAGYDNFAYFSRLFKNKVGTTPSSYQKMQK